VSRLNTGAPIPPRRVAELAALSRAFREAEQEINRAIVQEMERDPDPDWRAVIGTRFGLSEEELPRYQPEAILRLQFGFIHRAGLRRRDEVIADLLSEIEEGALKPGDAVPPRRLFTERYHCDKKTHQDVLILLKRLGLIARRAAHGGPMLVLDPPEGIDLRTWWKRAKEETTGEREG
jgi:hypothetical protein